MSEDKLTEEEREQLREALQPLKDELREMIGRLDALLADMRASSEAVLLTIETPTTKTVQ